MSFRKYTTLLLALFLLLQCAAPVLAVDAQEPETLTGDEPETVMTAAEEDPAQPVEPETESAEDATEPPTATEDVTESAQPTEPETELTEPETAPIEPETIEPETAAPLTEQVPTEAEPTQSATEHRLYNGLEADYDDPQFLKLLAQGFFDEEDSEAPRRANAVYHHNSAFKGYEITKGVDVSKWNNTINWKQVKNDGISFAIIRCGNRFSTGGELATDFMFDKNMKGAKAAGLEVGVYFFSQAINEREAIAEAKYTLNLVRGYSFSLPIVFDFEYYQNGRLARANLSRTQRTNICKAFCKTIEDAGYESMVYANRDMLTKDMYGEELPRAGYEVWLAEWNTNPQYGGTYTYWQYSDNGHIKGFDHQVDVNFRYRLPDANISRLASTGSGVKVTWNRVAPAEGYRVYRRQGTGAWQLLTTLQSGSILSYVDETAVAGRRYSYSVQPYDGLIDGTFDNTGSAITVAVALPAGATLATPKLTAATGSEKGIKVQWKPVLYAAGYRVYRKTDAGKWASLGIVEGGTAYLDRTAKAGKVYAYTVRAVNGKHLSGFDKTGIEGKVLATPKLLYACSRGGGKQVVVAWNPVAGATKYRVYRRVGDTGSWKALGTVRDTAFVDNSVQKGTAYRYTVRPYGTFNGKSAGGGYQSKGIGTTWLDMPALNAAKLSGSRIRVSWNAVSGAQKYVVYRKIGTSSWKKLSTVTKGRALIDTMPRTGVPVSYTVRAVSGRTVSGYDKTGVIGLILDAPVLQQPRQVSDGVQVRWAAVKGATSYTVFRKTGSGTWSMLAVSNSAAFTDTGVETGKSYTYTVKANATVQGQSIVSAYKAGPAVYVLGTPALNSAEWTADGVRLSFSAVSGAKGYRIYRRTNGGSWTKVGECTAATGWLDPLEDQGQNVAYTVQAVRDSSLGLYDPQGIVPVRPEPPSEEPTGNPTEEPTGEATEEPTGDATEAPTEEPSGAQE